MNFSRINDDHEASVNPTINGRIELVLKKERLTNIKNYFSSSKLALGSCIDYIKKLLIFSR